MYWKKKQSKRNIKNKIIDEKKLINMIKSHVNRLEENVCCEYIFIVMITNKTLIIENIERKKEVLHCSQSFYLWWFQKEGMKSIPCLLLKNEMKKSNRKKMQIKNQWYFRIDWMMWMKSESCCSFNWFMSSDDYSQPIVMISSVFSYSSLLKNWYRFQYQ